MLLGMDLALSDEVGEVYRMMTGVGLLLENFLSIRYFFWEEEPGSVLAAEEYFFLE